MFDISKQQFSVGMEKIGQVRYNTWQDPESHFAITS